MVAIKVHGMGWVSAINRYGNPRMFERSQKFALALSEWQAGRVKDYCKKLGWKFDVYKHSHDWHSRLTETERFVWEDTKKQAWGHV